MTLNDQLLTLGPNGLVPAPPVQKLPDKTVELCNAAIDYAHAGWKVFPLEPGQKNPATTHGLLDATDNLQQICNWWGKGPAYNIGLVPPPGIIIIDIDPRHNGHLYWQWLIGTYNGGIEPDTYTVFSGRGDGGRHLYFRHPGGDLNVKRLRTAGFEGIDLKNHRGYVVAPPSIHPDSGQAYRGQEGPVADCPDWLAQLLRKPEPKPQERVQRSRLMGGHGGGGSIEAANQMTWADILEPHGWRLVSGNGDEDESRWRHPTATCLFSATIRTTSGVSRLYVYSPNTPFDVTEAGDQHGYSKFDAVELLNGQSR